MRRLRDLLWPWGALRAAEAALARHDAGNAAIRRTNRELAASVMTLRDENRRLKAEIEVLDMQRTMGLWG